MADLMEASADGAVEIAVLGGTGFYRFLDDITEVAVQTPYGPPSARVAVGEMSGRTVAFLPRHGAHHELPAHRVNFRANVWALRSLGVERVFGPCAAGSLDPACGRASSSSSTSSSTEPPAGRTPTSTARS